VERLSKGGSFQATLMGVTLAAAVYCERRCFDCWIKRRLVSKPVDLSLGSWPDSENLRADDSF